MESKLEIRERPGDEMSTASIVVLALVLTTVMTALGVAVHMSG